MVVGQVYESSAFKHRATVVDTMKYPFVKVMFEATGNIIILRRCNLKSLEFRDVDQPTVFGVGVVGDIKVRVGGKLLPSYVAWTSLLERCKKRGGIVDRVCPEWLKFLNFKEWYDSKVPNGWVVDKDYKYIGNQYYSEETCTPLPVELNSVLVKTSSSKGYTLTRNGKFDSRVRTEGTTVARKTFSYKGEALNFYIDEKSKYINRLRVKYKDSVPDYVFDNALLLLKDLRE